jgi:D-alanyl-D-alanine carboxypeptidase
MHKLRLAGNVDRIWVPANEAGKCNMSIRRNARSTVSAYACLMASIASFTPLTLAAKSRAEMPLVEKVMDSEFLTLSKGEVSTEPNQKTHSIIAAVARDGFLYESARGTVSPYRRAKITPGHQFPIASVTKVLTSVVIMQLMEEGKLGPKGLDTTLSALHIFDDSVTDRLVAINGANYGREITIRHLLAHRAGLRDVLMDDASGTSDDFDGNPAPGSIGGQFSAVIPEHLACLQKPGCSTVGLATTKQWGVWDATRPADADAGLINYYLVKMADKALSRPGENYHYSDTGYMILGLVIERLTGLTLHQVYRTRLFDPIAMSSTFLDYSNNPPPQRYTHDRGEFYLGDVPVQSSGLDLSFDWAGGGVVSTAGDMARFASTMCSGKYFKQPQTMIAMTTWHTHNNRGDYVVDRGLGPIRINTKDGLHLIGHFGFWGSAMFCDPESGIAIAGTVNEAGDSPADWVVSLFRAARRDMGLKSK